MEDKKEMLALRERGLTYQEIADIYHITRQRVHQIIGKENVRKSNVDIERIVYKGVYEFMRDDPDISYTSLLRAFATNISKDDNRKFARFLQDKSDSGKLTIGQIKRLIKFTGKSFEELFERRN